MTELTPEEVEQRWRRASRQPPRTLHMSPEQSALLYNLLSDNARAWNAPLREQLRQIVTPTEAYNAKLELQGRGTRGPDTSTT